MLFLKNTPINQILSMTEMIEAIEDTLKEIAEGRGFFPVLADKASEPLAKALEAAVADRGRVTEVVQYRVGPSVAAHTGPGTAGCFMFPA